MALWSRDPYRGLDGHRGSLEIPVTLRLAAPADLAALERLADLDSRSLSDGPHLIAERARRVDAALSLRSGEVIADPFLPTAALWELLRLHAAGAPADDPEPQVPAIQPRPIPATP